MVNGNGGQFMVVAIALIVVGCGGEVTTPSATGRAADVQGAERGADWRRLAMWEQTARLQDARPVVVDTRLAAARKLLSEVSPLALAGVDQLVREFGMEGDALVEKLALASASELFFPDASERVALEVWLSDARKRLMWSGQCDKVAGKVVLSETAHGWHWFR